jgi:hypothetical protein
MASPLIVTEDFALRQMHTYYEAIVFQKQSSQRRTQ